jgi:hypothetical protein
VRFLGGVAFLFCSATAACGGVTRVQHGPPLSAHARWIVLPIENHSETPLAGERLEAIVSTVLRARGVGRVDPSPPPADPDAAVTQSDRQRSDEALEWGRAHGYVYGVAGSVEEWRYKSGLDGEPAIGLTLRVVRIADDTVVWSGTTSRTGWTHESVSSTALRAVDDLVDDIKLSP